MRLLVTNYKNLKKELLFNLEWEGDLFLCGIVLEGDYPLSFYYDLKERLRNLDNTDKDLRNHKLYLSSESIVNIGSTMWHHEDHESRLKFINRTIKRLW